MFESSTASIIAAASSLASFCRLREQFHHGSKFRLKHEVGLKAQVLCAMPRDQERLQAFLNQDKCCARSFLFARIQGGASGRGSAFWLHSTWFELVPLPWEGRPLTVSPRKCGISWLASPWNLIDLAQQWWFRRRLRTSVGTWLKKPVFSSCVRHYF